MAMPRTLYGRLALTLLALLLLAGALHLALVIHTTRRHVQEVTQRLHQPLAANIVTDRTLMLDAGIDQAALDDVLHMLMVVNPSIEVYLTDPDGALVAFSAPPGEVVRERIDLAPVAAFLDGDTDFPLLGDDPREARGRKIFSAAPITDEGGRLHGYLYIVLGGQHYDSVAGMFEQSEVFRLGLGLAVLGLLITLIVGFLAFHWLTRRLRRLSGIVRAFERVGHAQAISLPDWQRGAGADEIDQLGIALEQMSARIAGHLRDLERVDTARRELVAQVSHDLRTPLAALQGYLETLLIKRDRLAMHELCEHLEQALRHARRLGHLIDELFELATLQSDDAELRPEPFSLAELAQDVAQKFQLSAEAKPVRLEVEVGETAPFVAADISRIERVLDNLLDNAIKYTPPGGVVRVGVTAEPDQVEVAVSDDGPGIAEADLERIFELFQRAEGEATRGIEGTGLGLAIARRILELHGAQLKVASRIGAGSRFWFRLPALAATSRERSGADQYAIPS
jgi:two-component system OmpR family sensor kinase